MLIADYREKQRPEGRLILDALGDPPEATLQYADFLLTGQRMMGIEIVTPSGLLQDMASGRLVAKLSGCARDYELVGLLITGLLVRAADGRTMYQHSFNLTNLTRDDGTRNNGNRIYDNRLDIKLIHTGWKHKAVMQILGSVALRWAHAIEFVLSPVEAAERLTEWHSWLQKPGHALDTIRERPMFSTAKRDYRKNVLAELPGIGHYRANLLIGQFGSIANIANASIEQLERVQDIGSVLAASIHQSFRSVPVKEIKHATTQLSDNS